ncbi:hypothetical protein AUK57_00840 [Candidatus Saccharibacteria bacterium CG2_30_41_52]|nr:MAG: hypothetical protein AUK57_00840 [Candidatus Saccharibacteria bacterium CG2_30_41_52]
MALYNLNNPAPIQRRNVAPMESEDYQDYKPQKLGEFTSTPADEPTLANNGKNHVKELTEERESNSVTYLNEDGTKTTKYSTLPLNYKDKQGNWQEIKTSIKADSFYSLSNPFDNTKFDDALNIKKYDLLSGDSNTNTKPFTGVSDGIFSPKKYNLSTGDITANMKPFTEGVEIIYDSKTYKTIPVDANNVLPKVKYQDGRQIIVYENAWDGVNVEYAPVAGSIKESIILTRPGVASTFKYEFIGGELIQHSTIKGAFAIKGVNENDFYISPLVIMTQQKGPVSEEPGEQTTDGSSITISVDTKWLKEQTAADYPIIIDPTFSRQPATGNYKMFKSDGYSCDGYVCYANTGSLNDGSWKSWRTLIYFSYQSPLQGKTVTNAVLHGYFQSGAGGNTTSRSITMGHAPCIGYSCLGSTVGTDTTVSTNFDIDFTAGLKARVDAGDYGAWWSIRGVESSSTTTYKPYSYMEAVITYDTKTPMASSTTTVPANKGVVTTIQPSLKVNPVTDADGDVVKYYFRVATNSDAQTGMVINSGWIGSNQWTVPDGILKDGVTYYWKAYTMGALETAPNWANSFKVDLRTGKDSTQVYDSVGPVSIDLATGNATTSTGSHSMSALGGSLGINLNYNSPAMSSPGLLGQYWNSTFSGDPIMTRVDSGVAFDWSTGTPATGIINTDSFTARWTGFITVPTSGNYEFGCTVDDRCDVYVNNNLIVTRSTPGTGYGSSIAMTAGVPVPYKIEMRESTSTAKIFAKVKGAVAEQTIPDSWFSTSPRATTQNYGLEGRYYTDDGSHAIPTNASDPNRLLMTRNDSKLKFTWTGAPAVGLPSDSFLVRWKGYLTVPVAGSYILGASGDDGIRINLDYDLDGDLDSVLDSWSLVSGNRWGSAKTLPANTKIPIQVDLREVTSTASLTLLIDPPTGAGIEMPVTWLTPSANTLPEGWDLAVGDGNARFERLAINNLSATLSDSTGQKYEYSWDATKKSYIPPTGENAVLSRNTDNTYTVTDADGRVYIFDAEGKLTSLTSPTDDRQPAAIKYEYEGNPSRLKKVIDGVDDSRYGTLHYSGDNECVTGNGLSPAPVGMLCAFKTTDGDKTLFQYNLSGRLARVVAPGNAFEDYDYDSLGRIVAYRDVLANDAIASSQRSDDSSVKTEMVYDATGRVSSIKAPSANAGDYRVEHTIEYLPNKSKMHIVGASEPHGFSKQVEYDSMFRTTKETNLANLSTTVAWDTNKDLVLYTQDTTGLRTTNIYNDQDILTDTYGPAPSAWFDATTRLPIANQVANVPHVKSGYDEGISGFDTSWYNLKSANMTIFDAPIYNNLGYSSPASPANSNPANTRFDWRNHTLPVTPDTSISGVDGYAVRAKGRLTFPSAGTYTFKAYSDDSIRLYVDGQEKITNWGTKTEAAAQNIYTATFTAIAGKTYDVLVEYGHVGTAGAMDIWLAGPGIVDQSSGQGLGTRDWSSYLKPGYYLNTSTTSYDAELGNTKTTTEYSNPAYGTVSQTTIDPDGLALENQAAYEAPGAGFLRQTSRTTTGGSVFTYNYYGATEAIDNPCTLTSDPVSQAGRAKGKTEPDPDGVGSKTGRTTETVYDTSGGVVATRYNNDAWTCIEYDARGRAVTTTIPARGNLAGRTITNNFAVSGNPFVTSSTDSSGTVTVTTDLLGRTASYIDAGGHTATYVYDNYGKPTSKTSLIGTESYEYDSYDRMTVYKLDNVTFATVSYDQYSRISNIEYQSGIELGDITRDQLGRETGSTYTLADSTTLTDTVSRSVSGKITSGIENGIAKSYQYDGAGRLVSAAIGDSDFTYTFGSSDSSCDSLSGNNVNAGNGGNRTSQTINGVAKTYCYDYADRLIASSDSTLDNPIYDDHGNTVSLGGTGQTTEFSYDVSDRNDVITDSSGSSLKQIDYKRDVQNRIISRSYSVDTVIQSDTQYAFTGSGDTPDALLDSNGNILQKYVSLPGGISVTINPQSTSAGSQIYSLTNMHGDVFATVNADGALTGVYITGPFGEKINVEQANNAAAGTTYGYLGQFQKLTESDIQLNVMQMGARLYLPSLGRFLQVDPYEGGTPNSYVYMLNPVSQYDLDGTWGWGDFLTVVSVVATVVAVVTTGPVAVVAVAVAVGCSLAQGDVIGAALSVAAAPLKVAGLAVKAVRTIAKAVTGGAKAVNTVSKSATATSKASQMLANAAKGRAAENKAANALSKSYGPQNVSSQVNISTPYGTRRVDFMVSRPNQANLMVEVKSGAARYGGTQMKKDLFIQEKYGYGFELMRY